MTNPFAVGQKVRVIKNELNPLASIMAGRDINAHALPVGSVVEVLELYEGASGSPRVYVSTDGVGIDTEIYKPGRQSILTDWLELA